MMNEVSSPNFWQSHYQQNRIGWDLGEPTPVFRRLLATKQFPPGRMIVPGAGRGFDARLFARHGFQVTAVDFAPAAIQAMREENDPEIAIAVLQSDIFDLPPSFVNSFDYVLEYTCFCAIHPRRRDEYADVVANLLRPGGIYIGLAFPVGEGNQGPPFPVSPDRLIKRLRARQFVLQHREFPADSVPARRGHEELIILKKDPHGRRQGEH